MALEEKKIHLNILLEYLNTTQLLQMFERFDPIILATTTLFDKMEYRQLELRMFLRQYLCDIRELHMKQYGFPKAVRANFPLFWLDLSTKDVVLVALSMATLPEAKMALGKNVSNEVKLHALELVSSMDWAPDPNVKKWLTPSKDDENKNEDIKNKDIKSSSKKPAMGLLLKPHCCVICLNKNPTHALIPCGHRCLCSNCVSNQQQINTLDKCPLCRKNVTKIYQIYT